MSGLFSELRVPKFIRFIKRFGFSYLFDILSYFMRGQIFYCIENEMTIHVDVMRNLILSSIDTIFCASLLLTYFSLLCHHISNLTIIQLSRPACGEVGGQFPLWILLIFSTSFVHQRRAVKVVFYWWITKNLTKGIWYQRNGIFVVFLQLGTG